MYSRVLAVEDPGGPVEARHRDFLYVVVVYQGVYLPEAREVPQEIVEELAVGLLENGEEACLLGRLPQVLPEDLLWAPRRLHRDGVAQVLLEEGEGLLFPPRDVWKPHDAASERIAVHDRELRRGVRVGVCGDAVRVDDFSLDSERRGRFGRLRFLWACPLFLRSLAPREPSGQSHPPIVPSWLRVEGWGMRFLNCLSASSTSSLKTIPSFHSNFIPIEW